MINDELVRLGRVIARTRTEKRLTQLEVARRADMERSDISRIEHGRRDPRLDTLLRLAEVLETPLGALLSSKELAAHQQSKTKTPSAQTRQDKTSDREGASTMSGTPVKRDAVLVAGASCGDQTRLGASQFAENIARVRREKHLSQSEVSRRSGVHITEVSRIERGLRDPRISTLIRLARSLDIEPGQLLEETSSAAEICRRGP
jgi:transcriptional regulator with XRE-family HTH domain